MLPEIQPPLSPRVLARKLKIEKTPDPKLRRRWGQKSKGKQFGMGICDFWATLFQMNELLGKGKKMTDEEIKRQVLLEYPDRKSVQKLGAVGERGEVTVNYYRHLYNTGRLTRGVVPERLSRRYNELGVVVSGRTGLPENQKDGNPNRWPKLPGKTA